jgi:poly(A) polymerase
LRILRFIRFSLEYNSNIENLNVIKIINKNVRFLKLISSERLFIELKKILELKNLESIKNKNYFKKILNKVYQLRFFERLKKVRTFKTKLNYLELLAILLVGYDTKHIYFSKEFRLSNKEKDYLNFIASQFKSLRNTSYHLRVIKKQLYFYKKELALDFLNFIFYSTKKISFNNLKKYQLFIKRFKIPAFPISGNFLIRRGFKQGKSLGKKLESLKNSWIENDFKFNL